MRAEKPISVLILLPPAGRTPAEVWMAQGRRAAAIDLVGRLQAVAGAGPIWFHAAEQVDCQALTELGCRPFDDGVGLDPFHYGEALASFARLHAPDRLGYFGGASAPLVSTAELEHAFDLILRASSPTAVVNNYYSTDWLILNETGRLPAVASKLPTDNPLGWVLDHDAGFGIQTMPVTAGTQADIDTPGDLLLIHAHPSLGPALTSHLEQAPQEGIARAQKLQALLRAPASTLSIIGRSSAGIWREIERRTQIWVRLFVEERGMLASGRAERGEVRSLIASVLDLLGPTEFIQRLSTMTDGVLWDTRVWMASRRVWPSPADRFASDLGWADQVAEPALRDLTASVAQATFPIITGGHGVVAGSLLALLETIAPRA